MLSNEHLDAAREIRAELNTELHRDEVMLIIYERQLLTSTRKEDAQKNIDAKKFEINAVKKLMKDLDEIILENSLT